MKAKILNQLLLKYLRYPRSTAPQRQNSAYGFTLIELLVAMIMAALVVTGLLSLVVKISDADRRELAKSSSQQELQNALDFIVKDMQEAVYIYDSTGLAGTGASGIGDNIPPTVGITTCDNVGESCQPVLAFWKRRSLDRCDALNDVKVGIVTGQAFVLASRPNTGNLNSPTECQKGNDTYVYSLVVYYLIRDNAPTANWSRAARIGRFEIRDGVPNPTIAADLPARFTTAPAIPPSNGFQTFKLPTITSDTRIQAIIPEMNGWKNTLDTTYGNAASAYQANDLQVLADYMDDTPLASATTYAPNVDVNNILATQMPIRLDNSGSNPPALVYGPADQDCQNSADGAMGVGAVRVPAQFAAGQFTSFFACINAQQNGARIYLRGNALARLYPNQLPNRRPVTRHNLGYLPMVEARIFGRGLFVPSE